jgi:tRNA A37 threonylcarbamoyladenosine synthetase subunit TsaC/SUA5/YrdC
MTTILQLNRHTEKRLSFVAKKLGLLVPEFLAQAIQDICDRALALPPAVDSFQPTPVRFEDLRTDFEAGARLRRSGWCQGFYIVQTKHSRFVTLSNGRVSKQWEPYAEDFSRTDWYSLD